MTFRTEGFSFDKFKPGGLHEKQLGTWKSYQHLLENGAEHEKLFQGDRSQMILISIPANKIAWKFLNFSQVHALLLTDNQNYKSNRNTVN
jgi:hypothetical protein